MVATSDDSNVLEYLLPLARCGGNQRSYQRCICHCTNAEYYESSPPHPHPLSFPLALSPSSQVLKSIDGDVRRTFGRRNASVAEAGKQARVVAEAKAAGEPDVAGKRHILRRVLVAYARYVGTLTLSLNITLSGVCTVRGKRVIL